jgi:hypothetical protein
MCVRQWDPFEGKVPVFGSARRVARDVGTDVNRLRVLISRMVGCLAITLRHTEVSGELMISAL